jgi:hypothetical protein
MVGVVHASRVGTTPQTRLSRSWEFAVSAGLLTSAGVALLDRPEPAEHRHSERSARLGTGTLACPGCDAPVALTAGPHSPVEPLRCPYCARGGPLREFLSLRAPTRPARVAVHVRLRAPARR